ncbi:MFS transporter [Williamsia sp. Leaf354]|uniref:MFS transporter n=1 Tax=Williamsia sp. Leaf354 TaxID=1736349 RepID=UPI0006F2CFB9|nr:MFS transporter [Williamsia sp. Leaf354]KQR98144.1 MFS transporter [Williamsia sp. Leaf354]
MSIPSVRRSPAPSGRVPGALSRHLGTLVLISVLGCQLMVVVDATIVNVALPDIQRALGFSSTSLSWVLNAYTLTFGGLLLLGARMGDILGRRRTFLGGLALFVVASMAGGFAVDGVALLVARAAQGVGAAVAAPAALALLMTRFPEGRERNRALGLFTAVSIGGFSIGLVLGGALTQWLNWRWVLFVNVPIGIVVLIAGALSLPATERSRKPFDLQGALYSTVGIGMVVYGLVNAAEKGWSDAVTLVSLIVGVALLGAFVVAERRAAQPITPLRLFASVPRSASYAGRLVMVAGFMGMMFFLTQFLQDVLHYGPLQTGLAYLPMTASTFAATQFSARYASVRFSGRALLMVGFGLAIAGMLWLTQIHQGSSYLELIGPMILIGLGGGTSFLSLTTAALRGVAPADAGAASGMVNAMQQLGGTLGLAVLVTVFGSASAAAGGTPLHAFTAGVQQTFWASAILLGAGMVLMALTQGERRQRAVDNSTESIATPVEVG